MKILVLTLALVLCGSALHAQVLSQRGFGDARGFFFPQTAPNDDTQAVADALFREEVFVKPASWIQFAGGFDLRGNSHDQVTSSWDLDWEDRGILRPRTSIRRLSATVTGGGFTLDVGKQFIRWARADILNPNDRFAPRDFLNVIDAEYLPVTAVRPSMRVGSETFEAVWTPQLTPSRMPLLDQRWTVLPPGADLLPLVDAGSSFPERSQYGARYTHTGGRIEGAFSYFDGFNHLPTIDVELQPTPVALALTRGFPRLRTYGGDVGVPTPWFAAKAEVTYFMSPTDDFDSYTLYVIEIERQTGEWVLTGGYAGEVASTPLSPLAFDPERGIARSILGRASYTVDPRRTVTIEGALRQNGDGQYVKGDYSQALGSHWRMTFTGVVLAGDPSDFLGQFNRNSHVSAGLRFSF
jgi:hypothetical protein